MYKILILTYITFILIACNSKNAVDFEDDKNRIVSEMIRDTIFRTDSIEIVRTEVVHDTIRDTIYDTLYVEKERRKIEYFIDAGIEFTESWFFDKKPYTSTSFIDEKQLSGRFLLDSSNQNSILSVNLNFTRRRDNIPENINEWLHKLIINSHYLELHNQTTLQPFGQNLGFFHYFTAVTTNKGFNYFTKTQPNYNLVIVSFEEQSPTKMNMYINGEILKENVNNIDSTSFISFRFKIPLSR